MSFEIDETTLVDQLRKENPEQYIILVKMHLSFILDLNTDESDKDQDKPKRSKRSMKKKTKPFANADSLSNTKGIDNIYMLMGYISEKPLILSEGLFRITGSLLRQQELKSLIHRAEPITIDHLQNYSVHDCASVLKGFLSDLEEPLLTDAHYAAYQQVAELCKNIDSQGTGEIRILQALQLLILLLPEKNRLLLKTLLELLNKTASYEKNNKMSADSLATLFTPHLMCPKNLSPQDLHSTSQSLRCVASLMISKAKHIFSIPVTLATDIRAYIMEQKRKQSLTPEFDLNESISDTTSTANTVFTFVDREKTAQAHISNPTETALAQLYAHIQSLPDSSKKRKLIKQFNKENGQGTPSQFQQDKQVRGKSLGDSIKRHIFQKGLSSLNKTPIFRNEHIPSPKISFRLHKSRLFQNCMHDSQSDVSIVSYKECTENCVLQRSGLSQSCEALTDIDALDLIEEETSVTPNLSRSQRFVSEPNLNNLSTQDFLTGSPEKGNHVMFPTNTIKNSNICKSRVVSTGNLKSIAHETKTIKPHSKFFCKQIEAKIINKVTKDNIQLTPPVSISQSSSYSTSTPAVCIIQNDIDITPLSSNYETTVSPITKSTQRMSRAMQESIMTPRSRKPLVMLSGTNLCNLATMESVRLKSNNSCMDNINECCDMDIDKFPDVKQGVKKIINTNSHKIESMVTSEDEGSPSLTNTFRDYLYSRSAMTNSPMVDNSFSSRPDDFQSNPDIPYLSETELSDSMLYCLNGNDPEIDHNAKNEEMNCEKNITDFEFSSCTTLHHEQKFAKQNNSNIMETSL